MVPAAVVAWQPRTVGPDAADFARRAVAGCGPLAPGRTKNLLWATAQLGAFAEEVGLELDPRVVLAEAVLERFIAVACRSRSAASRRTLRTKLRFVARRVGHPAGRAARPAAPRPRAKGPRNGAENVR